MDAAARAAAGWMDAPAMLGLPLVLVALVAGAVGQAGQSVVRVQAALAASGTHPCVDRNGAAAASCFGFDRSDSTDILHAAFASGASLLTIDSVRRGGKSQPWIVRPLILNVSNIAIQLDADVTILAKRDEFHGLGDSSRRR